MPTQEHLSTHAKPKYVEEYFSIPEAAELLRSSPNSVAMWLSQGRLLRVKAGRRTLIARSEIEEFMQRSTALAETEEAKQRRRELAEKRRRSLIAEAVRGRR
jgi:excisionase family DNA binding protein